jgi:cell division protease FtsH
VLGFLAIALIFEAVGNVGGYVDKPTSEVVALINSDTPLTEVILTDGEQSIKVTTKDGRKLRAYWVGDQVQSIIDRLNQRQAAGSLDSWTGENPQPSVWSTFLYSIVPFLLLGVLFFIMFNNVQGGGNRVLGFGKSKAKLASKDTPKTTFTDVAGCEEAIEELQEIREFLSEPAKFTAVGAKIPKGVLLYGPPGTGKTLLARAVAGEAGVPFFSISGSDFVEMFVGVGASRVRDLFEQAKEAAPAIVFIDEIDAVGRHRGAGLGGGHDEREQTLNQLLVEMDGFDVHGGVVLIAATNRPDVLDPALLRPGRFDRQIPVEAPDMKGRLQILRVHGQNKPLAPDVDLSTVAKRTPGFTGADLANVLNEAALLTARLNLRFIGKPQLDEAIDRVIGGPQKRSRVMNERELLITAYHEGGHALVAAAMPGTDPVQKVTILPRGRALGYTMVMPDDDKYSQTRGELLDQLAYMLGGRAAEELVFHDPTTGAGNDIEKATKLARAMVTEYGMTEALGAVKLGSGDQEPFLGMNYGAGSTREYSEEVAAKVDAEVSRLIANAHQEAFDVLETNRAVLDELVRQLFEKETLDKEQVAKIFEALKRWPKRPAWTGSESRKPSDIPPVDPPERVIPPDPEPALTPAGPSAFPQQPPYGQGFPYGQPPYGQPPFDPSQQQPYGQYPPPFGQFPPQPYGQPYPPVQGQPDGGAPAFARPVPQGEAPQHEESGQPESSDQERPEA